MNPETPDPGRTLNRRELFKALAATSGALTTAAFLPIRWSRPEMDSAFLPSHALATPGDFDLNCFMTTRQGYPVDQIYEGDDQTLHACVRLIPPKPGIDVQVEVYVDNQPHTSVYATTQSGGAACTPFTRDYAVGEFINIVGSIPGTPGGCTRGTTVLPMD